MLKQVLAALVAALCVTAPIKIDGAPDTFLTSADASAAKRPDMVTIDLALLLDGGNTASVTWIRIFGDLDELTNSVSSNDQVSTEDLLALSEWEIVSIDPVGWSTTASVASSIDAEMDGQSQRQSWEYEILYGTGLWARGFLSSVVGRLTITRDSPRAYSGLGYIDFSLVQERFSGGSGGNSEDGATPMESPLLMEPAAASASGETSSRYLVWPEQARLGETVAVLLETQSEVELYADGAMLNASVDTFEIYLTDEWGESADPIRPRAVIEVPAALGSNIVGLGAGSWAGIALLFDLPNPWPLGPTPPDLTVRVDYDGYQVFNGKMITISTDGGAPLSAAHFEPLSDLQHRPMLRLRPSWEPTAGIGFDPTWEIGGLEFTLRFTPPADGDVNNLTVVGNGEAIAALAMATELPPDGGDKLWKITLVHPQGFTLPDKGCYEGDCYAGRWSLLDLTCDKDPEGLTTVGASIFSAVDFAIEDLKVIDVDGVQLNPAYLGETFFLKYAVNNLVDPPPPEIIIPAENHAIWPRQAYVGDTIAFVFNTEGDVGAPPDAAPEALLDADAGNVMVHITDLTDPPIYSEPVQPSAVIELPAARGSKKVGSPTQSQTGVIAFFELPDPSLMIALPNDFRVRVEYRDAPIFAEDKVTIVGTGGAETDFTPVAALGSLALGPMLRLRPAWDPNPGIGFDPTWEIGGLEFTLRFTPPDDGDVNTPDDGDVNNLTVVGNGEAIAALAMATELPRDVDDRLWKITLVHPEGFTLPDKGCDLFDDCFFGRWSLLDFPLEKVEGDVPLGDPVFIASDFSIEALTVFDLNGIQRVPPSSGEAFFHTYAVNNIALPEPGTNLQLVFGALGLALLNGLRHRRQQGGVDRK